MTKAPTLVTATFVRPTTAAVTGSTPSPDREAARSIAVLLLASTLVRLGLAVLLDLGVDEAYARAIGARFDLSYFDHPPMAFWIVGAMRWLFGADAPNIVLRLPFVLAFTATTWALYDLTRRLFDARAGLWAAVALTLSPFFLLSAGSWLVPDGPLVLFLALAARSLAIALFEAGGNARARAWLTAGLWLGLAGLSKYHAAFFALGAFGFVLATRHRRQLLTPWPWFAVVVAGLVAAPVFVWNAEHGFVSFLFQAGRGSAGTHIAIVPVLQALGGQAGYLLPWTMVGLAVALALACVGHRASERTRFLAALALPPIVLFTILPLWAGRGLPHWQMPGWLFAFPLLGVLLDRATAAGRRWPTRVATGTVALWAMVIGAAGALMLIGLPQGAVSRLGIAGFAEESFAWRGLKPGLAARGLLEPGRFVVSSRWIDAGRIAEALGGVPVAVFDPDPRGFAFLTNQTGLVGRDALIVTRPHATAKTLAAAAPLFASIEPQDRIPIVVLGAPLFELDVALARGLKAPYPSPYP